MNIFDKPIKLFLDSLDKVLNSNSFILDFIMNDDIIESINKYLKSTEFIEQILQQDKDRNYLNFYFYDFNDNEDVILKKKIGKIINKRFHLEIAGPIIDKYDYLIEMLTGDSRRGHFFSFYHTEKTKDESKKLIDDFIFALTNGENWELYTIDPSIFEYNYENNEIGYIDEYGNNNIVLIICNRQGYLILTNGTS